LVSELFTIIAPLFLSQMDFVVAAAVDFSLHQIGFAAQPTGHSYAAASGALPQQQPPSLIAQNNDSYSHVSVVPLHIIGTSTSTIVILSNTQQIVSLKLTNINYLY
jgi:hypothetical protein